MTDELDDSILDDDLETNEGIVVDSRQPKVAFAFSKNTGEFLRKTYADPDQLDLDNWLLPKFATYIEPPEVSAKQTAVFDGESWNVVSDYRDTVYYDKDGTKHTITELDVELPVGALLEAPVIPPTIEEQTTKVQAQCKARIYAQWDVDQQWNALAGADGYTADDLTACLDWVNQCRAARDALLADEATLVTIDVTNDKYWPMAVS